MNPVVIFDPTDDRQDASEAWLTRIEAFGEAVAADLRKGDRSLLREAEYADAPAGDIHLAAAFLALGKVVRRSLDNFSAVLEWANPVLTGRGAKPKRPQLADAGVRIKTTAEDLCRTLLARTVEARDKLFEKQRVADALLSGAAVCTRDGRVIALAHAPRSTVSQRKKIGMRDRQTKTGPIMADIPKIIAMAQELHRRMGGEGWAEIARKIGPGPKMAELIRGNAELARRIGGAELFLKLGSLQFLEPSPVMLQIGENIKGLQARMGVPWPAPMLREFAGLRGAALPALHDLDAVRDREGSQ